MIFWIAPLVGKRIGLRKLSVHNWSSIDHELVGWEVAVKRRIVVEPRAQHITYLLWLVRVEGILCLVDNTAPESPFVKTSYTLSNLSLQARDT